MDLLDTLALSRRSICQTHSSKSIASDDGIGANPTNVAYYPDLSPCPYFGKAAIDKLVAVGWLDEAHPYPQDEVSESFLTKLFDLLVRPWAPSYFMGYAECPFCAMDGYGVRYKDKKIVVGAFNLFVPGAGFLYAAPSMLAHYILTHNYAPPPQFQQAVLNCPPMGSPEYYQAIVENGPQSFAEAIEPSRR